MNYLNKALQKNITSSNKKFSEMKCFKNELQESKQALKQNFGVRIQDIHHQGIHLLHEIHTQACTHKGKQHDNG